MIYMETLSGKKLCFSTVAANMMKILTDCISGVAIIRKAGCLLSTPNMMLAVNPHNLPFPLLVTIC